MQHHYERREAADEQEDLAGYQLWLDWQAYSKIGTGDAYYDELAEWKKIRDIVANTNFGGNSDNLIDVHTKAANACHDCVAAGWNDQTSDEFKLLSEAAWKAVLAASVLDATVARVGHRHRRSEDQYDH